MLSVASIGLALAAYASGAAVNSTAANSTVTAGYTACPADSAAQYDYIIVGAGAGGGPLAARLALAGFKTLLVDAGHDVVNDNTTIPFYFARSNEDSQISLDYSVDLYASGAAVKNWYPRASGIGGSTIHNALINVDQSKYEFDTIATLMGDSSFTYDNMRQYFTKLEKNLWLDASVGKTTGHGYDGWMNVDLEPSGLISEPKNADQQLLDLYTGTVSQIPMYPNSDFNAPSANSGPGGGAIQLTKNANHQRSSVRDFLVSTRAQVPTRLTFMTDTLVTKVLTCYSTASSEIGLRAYGVEVAKGQALLSGAGLFKGKQTLSKTTVTAKYEVIVSGGTFETPKLLMLSGIGDKTQLASNAIIPLVNLPGVGANLQDRVENTVVWDLKQNHVIFNNCTFGDTSADPCYKAFYASGGESTLYASGPAIVSNITRSSSSLPYNDVWTMWSPGRFTGYRPGYPKELGSHPQSWTAVILKARTKARGWVKLASNNPQDAAIANKNLLATADSQNDYVILREAVKSARRAVTNNPTISQHIKGESWPGSQYATDAQLDAFLRTNSWGHHVCCTARMGPASDSSSVLDNKFKVRGVNRLRVVDMSVWPSIPGFFVTTPMYALSEKAAATVIADAASRGWKGTA